MKDTKELDPFQQWKKNHSTCKAQLWQMTGKHTMQGPSKAKCHMNDWLWCSANQMDEILYYHPDTAPLR